MNLLTNRKALYCLWFLILLIFLGIAGYKYKMEVTAISDNNIVVVKLIETSCNGIGSSHSSASFSRHGAIHLINLKGQDCNNYIPGSIVRVLYDAADDIYFPVSVSTKDEKRGIVILLLVILISALNFFFPKFFIFLRKIIGKQAAL